jgi:Ca-activated chloride channel family protein
MRRGFSATATATLVLGLLLGQSLPGEARTPRPPRPPAVPVVVPDALTAPPLIRAADAKIPVALREAKIEVESHGSLARTMLLLTLHNPNDRLLEGHLEFPLQPGQQVSAFALDIDGVLRDAVPVPKQKAQQVFESIERRNVDPGLLEQTAGNHFRLRVYPIPARGTRQVRLVIDEALRRDGDAWRLDVPVHLLDEADGASLSIQSAGLGAAPTQSGRFETLRFERRRGAYVARHDVLRERVAGGRTRPASTLALRLPASADAQAYVQSFDGERFALIDIPLPETSSAVAKRRVPSSVGLLWDASASARHRDRQGEFALLDRYFAAMGDGEVRLRVLRDVGEDGGRFAIRNGDWSALRKALETLVHDGASDLADWTPEQGVGEYLLVSDGLHNYGDRAFPQLDGHQALYALASSGAEVDETRLSALAHARGGRLVRWQGRDGLDAATDALLGQGRRVVALESEGIDDLLPQAWNVDDGLLRVSGRLTEPTARVRVLMHDRGQIRKIEASVPVDAPTSTQVAALWASWQVAAKAAEPERHRGAITRLGQRFGIVTPGTSLLVLESPEDYVRYDIPAPPALREQVAVLQRNRDRTREQSRSERLEIVATRFAERVEWWNKTFPKAPPQKPKGDRRGEVAGYVAADAAAPVMSAPPPPPSAPLSEVAAEELARAREAAMARRSAEQRAATEGPAGQTQEADLDRINVTGSRNIRRAELETSSPVHVLSREEIAQSADRPVMDALGGLTHSNTGQGVAIRLQAWAPDSPYARRLRDAKAEDLYALYLDEKDSHADSTAFYLDVADLLLKKDRRAEALRVLSNLAEMKLENRHVLRVLGYRLMQAGDWAHAVAVLREVLRLADEEPQSHRDLGLALAGAGQRQEAIQRLYDVAARPWDERFSEVELVALNEMNEIIATSPTPLDTAFIDRRLLKNMPLDLRVVLAWDSDNSDMDLWVTDPNGEKCYYGNRNTFQGGLLSDDFTGGYGPEEFVLKDAKPGKYKVEANFFGDRQQIVTGATTLNLRLSSGWGSPRRKDETVTLRLSGRSETVFVGEFEVK